jgi:hypothetical protein
MTNYIFLSPHFPPNFENFVRRLNEKNVNVLGIADQNFEQLSPTLQSQLKHYYKVDDLHQTDQVKAAVAFFQEKFGPVHFIESHNEYWMPLEAELRDDFAIPGIRTGQLAALTQKSAMKARFAEAGVTTAPGIRSDNKADIIAFAETHGYPVVAKPDRGVGASDTFKIQNREELDHFLNNPSFSNYFCEAFVDGVIHAFDGLTNASGDVVLFMAHRYSNGVMEVVNHDLNIYYYTLRDIPADLKEAGLKSVKAFGLRNRFFHLEFFRLTNGDIIGLEMNARPPGGFTLDMFNYANDYDIYNIYANLIATGNIDTPPPPSYHCAYAGRKGNRHYAFTHEDLMGQFSTAIMLHVHNDKAIGRAMGESGYLFRHREEKQIIAIANEIQKEIPK